jgi:hypothetical protein
MAIATEGDQIVGLLESEAGIRAVVHLEPVIVTAQFAAVAGALERKSSLPLPAGGSEVVRVRHPPQRRDAGLDVPINVLDGEAHDARGDDGCHSSYGRCKRLADGAGMMRSPNEHGQPVPRFPTIETATAFDWPDHLAVR